MDLEQCKQAEQEIQVVDHGHCSMGPATLDTQVDHTPGSLVVAEPVEVGKEHQEQGAYDKEVAAVVLYKGEEGEHNQVLQTAQEAESTVSGAEDANAEHFEDLMEDANWIFEFDGVGLLQDSCMSLYSYGLENLAQPFVFVHLQSFLDTGYFWSSQNHCTAV